MYWVGRYITLALVLPSSLAAGYILGAVADHFIHLPVLKVVGILLGMLTGVLQVLKELSRDEKRQ